jgi:8-oxo-dGTP pyrophosphatase MutT (NUDIX family)
MPEMAAQRLLKEETGLEADLSFWKRSDREHPLFTVDQHIFVGNVDTTGGLLVLGRDTQFFKPSDIQYLKIGYGFKTLLNEYFQSHAIVSDKAG